MKKFKALRRERVNRALESIFDYPMTIVEAPIGYGKTTAVREFLSAKGSPVLWLSFLSAGDTVSFFWDKLAGEISRLEEEAGRRLRSLGFPSDAPQAGTILSIFNELDCEKNTTLVIDDFHLVRSLQIGVFLAQLVKEEPDNFHIVVITRDTTNLEFAELSAKGLCNIMPQQLLHFTEAEIRDYCALMGHTPAEDELKKISEYTGGWISLVYLILLGIRQGIPVGRNSIIDELVEKVLYNAYDRRIQQFLLRLSVMDSFTVQQALFVTQESNTEELLKRLRRENAFIAYDDAAGVYKIHNVLLDFLRGKQQDEGALKELYLRAGEWFLTQKEYIPACGFLCRAGETERILSILNEEGDVTNEFGEFPGSMEMFSGIPREVLFKYPIAYLQYIGLLLMSGKLEAAHDGGVRLQELHTYYENRSDIPSKLKNRILAEINTIGILATFNDAEKMIACTNEALRLFDGAQSSLMTRNNEYTFGCPHFLYSYYKEPGSLKRMVELMVREFHGFPQLSNGCGTGSDLVTLAEFALETGDWQAAELNAIKTIYKAKTKDQTCIILCAGLTLIRLYIFQGRTDEGLELLRQLHTDVVRENNPVYNTTLELIDGYIYGCLTRPDGIPQWLQTGDMSVASFMYEGMAFNYIVYGKAVLLSKNYIKLEMLTEEFEQYFSIFHNQLGFLHNQIFEAVARYKLYGLEAGCASLGKALDMAREDHIILPFAEYAPAILDMLRYISHSDMRDAYIKEVLSSCEQYMEALKHVPESTVSLSARELEILTLAAEGLKRNEIAGRLNVSAGTVQTHLHNIYQKLKVSGRTAAIKKAGMLKLF